MTDGKKKLVIINGVTGTIGSTIFSHLVEATNYTVWGISRKGQYFEEFIDSETNKLPLKNLVFSLGDYGSEKSQLSVNEFVSSIEVSSITFIHVMGKFITEIDKDGQKVVSDDHDGDGINDGVKRLSYDVPSWFIQAFLHHERTFNFVQIGSLSDKHNIEIHGSWVKSIALLKEYLAKIERSKMNSLILNISSVLTPKELIERPFVSMQTNAEIQYWLPPIEIARYIVKYINEPNEGFFEKDLYRVWPKFSGEHFASEEYTDRRKKELFTTRNEKYSSIMEMEDGDSISFSLHNPLHLDKLWGELTLFLFDNHKRHNVEQPILFYNPRMWFFLLREYTEKSMFTRISDEGGTILLTCGNSSEIDRKNLEKEFSGLKHQFVLGNNHGMPNNYNLNIYGDYIIEVMLDKETSERIESFYNTTNEPDISSLKKLQDIVSTAGNNTLTVYRYKKRAEKLRSILSKDFDKPAGS